MAAAADVSVAYGAIEVDDLPTLQQWLQDAQPDKRVINEVMDCCVEKRQTSMFAVLLQAGASPERFMKNERYPPLISLLRKKNGDIDTLKVVLDSVSSKAKRYINTKARIGCYPLYFAIENENFECAKLLLERGAHVNGMNNFDRMQPLMVAAEKGSHELIKLLLEKGANVNKANATGERALSFAAKMGHISCLQELLHAGAEVNAVSKCGESALMSAVTASRPNTLAIVKKLISAGADVTMKDWRQQSALCHASTLSSEEVALYLADRLIERKVCNVDSSLKRAVQSGFAVLLEKLVSNGWKVNYGGTDEQSILHLAAERGSTDCLSYILQSEHMKQLDVNAERKHCRFTSLTPLHLAISWCHPEAVDLFLQYNADVDRCDSDGTSALVSCMSTSEPRTRATSAKLLLRHGCDINAAVTPKIVYPFGHRKFNTNFTRSCLAWALLVRELWMARMLWAAGAEAGEVANWTTESTLPLISHVIYLEDNYIPTASREDVLQFIQNVISVPRSLQSLSRIVIRSCLTRPVHKAISTLPLPTHIKDFLNVDELDQIEAENLQEDAKIMKSLYDTLDANEDFEIRSTSASGSESEGGEEMGMDW